MRTQREILEKLDEMNRRLERIDRDMELLRTVLIVREPDTVTAAEAYEGLRKQVIASSGERRSHLAKLTHMAVAVRRAADVADLRPQVAEWLQQAGIEELREVPAGRRPQDFFENIDGGSLPETGEVVEPAYVDATTGVVIRQGRVQRAQPRAVLPDPDVPRPAEPPQPADASPEGASP